MIDKGQNSFFHLRQEEKISHVLPHQIQQPDGKRRSAGINQDTTAIRDHYYRVWLLLRPLGV